MPDLTDDGRTGFTTDQDVPTSSAAVPLLPSASPPEHRRRRAWLRSLAIASAAAFAGGVAVVAVQYGLSEMSAGYPPLVQALLCAPEGEQPAANLALAEQGGATVPVIQVAAGTSFECRIEAPGADYATWSLVGPRFGIRSGPLDSSLACQSPEDFAGQSTARLRLSACQRARLDDPGLYLVLVTVMGRGHPSVDRALLAIRVPEPPPPPPPTDAAPRRLRLTARLDLPERIEEVQRTAELSASFSEHGVLPQSRDFLRTIYRLSPEEEYVSASFRARSASNASAVRLAYAPRSRSVTASFTLRSGPVFDRWRGWVSGTAVVHVRRRQDAGDVTLPEVELDVPGRATLPLPEGLEAQRARILLQAPGTEANALASDGVMRIDGATITGRIAGGTLVLEATTD